MLFLVFTYLFYKILIFYAAYIFIRTCVFTTPQPRQEGNISEE